MIYMTADESVKETAEFAEQARTIFRNALEELKKQGVVPGTYVAPRNIAELSKVDPEAARDALSGMIPDIDSFLVAPPPNKEDYCLCSMGLVVSEGHKLGIEGWKACYPRCSGGPIAFVINALDDTAEDYGRLIDRTKDISTISNVNDLVPFSDLLTVWETCGKENGWLP